MDISILSEREKKIYEMTMKGMSAKDIAAELGYTSAYISVLKRALYEKLGMEEIPGLNGKGREKVDFSKYAGKDLSGLTDLEKKVIELRIEGVPYADIAKEMALSLGSVYQGAHNARAKLDGTYEVKKHKVKMVYPNVKLEDDKWYIVSVSLNGKTTYVGKTGTLEDAIELQKIAKEKVKDGVFAEWIVELREEKKKKKASEKKEAIGSRRVHKYNSDQKKHLVSPDGEHFYIRSLLGWLKEDGKKYFKQETNKDIANIYYGLGQAFRRGNKYKGWTIEKITTPVGQCEEVKDECADENIDLSVLTEMERKIYEMTKSGMSSKEISIKLNYSNSRINTLKRETYAKLGKTPPKKNKVIGTYVEGFYIKDVKSEKKKTYAYAVCPYCGKEKWIRLDLIKNNNNVSCGCYNAKKRFIDLSDRNFNRLRAVKPTDERAQNGSVIWECECKCGNICYVSSGDLLRGRVGSCGCFGRENSVYHGKINGKNIVEKYVVDGTNINNLTAKISKANTSGIKGVSWDKARKKWYAQIEFKGKNYSLGRYDKKEDAAKIRKIAEEKMFGGFLQWFASQFPERWERYNQKRDKNERQ